jgi:hypothetical protein
MGRSAGRMTFLNQPAVFADGHAGLRQMWEQAFGNGRGGFTNSCAVAPGKEIS